MNKNNSRSLYIITFMIIIFGIIVSSAGLLYTTGGKSYNFVNQYGDIVKIYGRGLYAQDSCFKASTFRGTDFTILCVAIPILIISLVLDIKKKTLKSRLLLTGIISVFTYYSTSLVFGAKYNVLALLYIALFSSSTFGLIAAVTSMDKKHVKDSTGDNLPYKAIYTFLALTGIFLFAAWLPDIISSLIANRSLKLIEVYTTEITYALDIGIVAPTALICLFQLRKRTAMGYILLEILLTVCTVVGIMLPVQTVFETAAGITFPLPQLIVKSGTFIALALFAIYFNIRFFKNIIN